MDIGGANNSTADIARQIVNGISESDLLELISNATISLSPQSLSSAPAGTPVTVTIEVSAASVSWLPKPLFVLSQTIRAATTMRRESL